MTFTCKIAFLALSLFCLSSCSESNQKPDPDFIPMNTKNSFLTLNSPTVFIDEGHNNFHTLNGRFKPFAQVLMSDGYTVKPSKEKFTLAHLKQADILVIANALDRKRRDFTPPFGGAFDIEEVEAVKQWVSQGGSLFFIADHTPFPKVSKNLMDAFGFEFSNGHVKDATFSIENSSLSEHVITNKNPSSSSVFHSEQISKVKTFGGSAFQMPENAKPLLILGKGAKSLMPEIPFQINPETPRVSMDGWYQGAVLEVGEGRVAVFSEAMMFTSQVYTPSGKKMGLVSEGAEQNEQFLLNVMHWLSKTI